MKKLVLLSFALFMGTAVFAQTKKATNTGVTPKGNATQSAPGGSSNGVPYSCFQGKTWKLVKIEKFAVEKDPGEDQKKDMLLLNSDGTFKVILKGVEKTGTYSRGSWLSLKPADGSEMMPYKIEACDGSTLKADWRDGDTHNHFTYTLQ